MIYAQSRVLNPDAGHAVLALRIVELERAVKTYADRVRALEEEAGKPKSSGFLPLCGRCRHWRGAVLRTRHDRRRHSPGVSRTNSYTQIHHVRHVMKTEDLSNDNQVIVGATRPPVITSFGEALALPVSDRLLLIEDCPELPLVNPAS